MFFRSKRKNHQYSPLAVRNENTDEIVARTEKSRMELVYVSVVIILLLTGGVIVYAFNFEMMNALFDSAYFDNLVRISLALLIVSFIGYLIQRERNYSRQSKAIFDELAHVAEKEGKQHYYQEFTASNGRSYRGPRNKQAGCHRRRSAHDP